MANTNGFAALLWECGQENMGGMQNRLVFYPACKMKSVPTLPKKDDVVDDEDLASAEGAFVFKDAAGKPTPIYATDGTVQYTAETQGETDGKSFHPSGQFFFPGSLTQTSVFSRKVCNTPGYLVLITPEGEQIMVGQPGMPCVISPSTDFGQARSDRRGTTFAYEADSFAPYIKLKTPIDIDEIFDEAETGTPVSPEA